MEKGLENKRVMRGRKVERLNREGSGEDRRGEYRGILGNEIRKGKEMEKKKMELQL
jgi:hypothetical protein